MHFAHKKNPIDKRSVINEAREVPLYLTESLLGGRFADRDFIIIASVLKVTIASNIKRESTPPQAPTTLAHTPRARPNPIAPSQSKPGRLPLPVNKRASS